jgi:Concanavalin A-like lectin/glucanases superfamily
MVKLIIVGLLSVLIPNFSPSAAQANSCNPAATSTVDIYTVVTFTSTTTCNWTVPTGVTSIDLFMVGGGGGGGTDGGGGGGGGAAISRSAFAVTAGSSLALTVGAGGAPSTWAGYPGDNGTASTLVRTSPSVTLTANGGTKGGPNPGANRAGAGGSSVNGGFAGGFGGVASTAQNTKGGDGTTGISNYFLGFQTEYGGGGGGGSYYGASSFTETLGKSGGGNGGASAPGNNRPGNPGRANSGGGGGGGSANSPQQDGGRGADGVILIRYVIDPTLAFPASLSSSLSARFLPGDLQSLDATRLGWIDSSGQNSTVGNISFRPGGAPTITTQATTDGVFTVRSSKSLLTAAGTTAQGVFLPELPANYTLFHLARYQRTNPSLGRIISATGSNWLSGFWAGNQGVAHHNSWMTPIWTGTDYSWQLSADQTSLYKSNGLSVTTTGYVGSNPTSGFGINVGWSSTEFSTWQVADLMVFNRVLTASEVSQVENYMSLIYGLASSPRPIISPPNANESGLVARFDATNQSSYAETGTAWNDISGNGRHGTFTSPCTAPRYSSYSGGALSFDGSSNCALVGGSNFPSLETFTVEMWVNPRRGVTGPVPQTEGSALISTPHSPGQNVNFALELRGTNVLGGSYNEAAVTKWKTTEPAELPPDTWTHVALVSSAGTLSLYTNGAFRSSVVLGFSPAGSGRGVYVGRRWDGTQHYNGLISQVRILNTGLTAAQVRQNFYQSSSRYSTTAVGAHEAVKTFGETLTQVFSASSGVGNKTFSFTPNNRAGIFWDTSTANSATLSVATSLNAGTYYETMTVTDTAQSTSTVPLTITINKARQASLSIGQYNAFVNSSSYPINVYGGSTSAIASRSLIDSGTAGCVMDSSALVTAARVGTCSVRAVKAGDTNYLSETATATIYWIQWSDAYATRVPSTPTEIVLNHQTGITKYSHDTLTVTSYTDTATVPNTIASARVGQTIRIVGTGFSSTAAYTEVNFTNMEDMPTPSKIESTFIELAIPPGSQTGQVIVNMPGKSPAYGPVLTITP